MNIALHRCKQHLSSLGASLSLLRLDVWLQYAHRLFHCSCRFHDLREEHLSAAEELSHGVHSVHQRSLDDIHRLGILLQSFGEVCFEIVANAFY